MCVCENSMRVAAGVFPVKLSKILLLIGKAIPIAGQINMNCMFVFVFEVLARSVLIFRPYCEIINMSIIYFLAINI